MLEVPIADLRRCAGCHDQCQFASSEVFASGSMVMDTSRKASMLLALADGTLELSDRAVEVIYSGLSSGVQHSVCVFKGDPDGWPDEAEWLRAARAEVVRLGRAPAWAMAVRDGIVGRAGVTDAGTSSGSVVQLRGAISADEDADGEGQLSAIAAGIGVDLGLVEGEAGFELYDLGFVDDARMVATELAHRIDAGSAEMVISDSPEAVWMIREIWPTWDIGIGPRVHHVSEWLDGLAIVGSSASMGSVGFHDPAALVRGLRVKDAPRRILDRLGLDRIEFLRCDEETLPAGSYYGSAQGHWVGRLAQERLASASRLGMSQVVVASPFDLRSLRGGRVPVTTLHAVVARAWSKAYDGQSPLIRGSRRGDGSRGCASLLPRCGFTRLQSTDPTGLVLDD